MASAICCLLLLLLVTGILVPQASPTLAFNVPGNRTTTCREGERRALLLLKEVLVDNRRLLATWENNADCCNWGGVKCSTRTGHVVELELANSFRHGVHFEGTIMPSLLNLSHLRYLDLSDNDFNSRLPVSIASLRQLGELRLSYAGFRGLIPHSLGNLSRLRTLDLSFNRLLKSDGNLEWLSHLKLLRYLDLSRVEMSEANEWVQVVMEIPFLQTLKLSSCNLPGVISPSLSFTNSSTALKGLFLTSNDLTSSSIFPWIFNISSIQHSLETLDLRFNRIMGPLPDEISSLSSLKVLRLRRNNISGSVPESIGLLSKLEILDLSSNSLEGAISDSHFSNSHKLRSLDLSFNSLALNFSSNWVPPFQLGAIGLGSCNLGPDFPKWLRSQTSFLQLDLSNTGISDAIPSWFWDNLSPKAIELNLSHNQITGSFPKLVSHFTDFLQLDLSHNLLEGPLPSLLSFPNLASIDLSQNKISDFLPSICEFNGTKLTLLDLSNNRLSGPLPNCFDRWNQLKVLNLANNNLSGQVPGSLGYATSLEFLSLRDNGLSGNLPLSLKNCSQLIFLDVSDNKLTGQIPQWIGQSVQLLAFLGLQGNQFQGQIPHNLCGLKRINILDLSQNNLTGNIPECLNSLSSIVRNTNIGSTIEQDNAYLVFRGRYDLRRHGGYVNEAKLVWKGAEYEIENNLGFFKLIDLSGNKITGEIPAALTELLGLVGLNLSGNHLIRQIPREIGRLRQLQALDLSRNQLSGTIPTSMSELTFLGYLDLSHNRLSGRIPSGTQIQGFSPASFASNPALCGRPVSPSCPGDKTSTVPPSSGGGDEGVDGNDETKKWFWAGIVPGFGTGMLGIVFTLLLKPSWRFAYFRFLNRLEDHFRRCC